MALKIPCNTMRMANVIVMLSLFHLQDFGTVRTYHEVLVLVLFMPLPRANLGQLVTFIALADPWLRWRFLNHVVTVVVSVTVTVVPGSVTVVPGNVTVTVVPGPVMIVVLVGPCLVTVVGGNATVGPGTNVG